MLPPKYGIKRRRSRSEKGESSNAQSSLAAGGLRKRSRLGKRSKVLRGGWYSSKFRWPYYPLLSDEKILNWIRLMRQPLIDCFRTRQGTNRDGILTDEQVAMTDKDIERTIEMLDYFKDNDVGTNDMLDELMDLLKFTNLFVVTNMTPNTSVKLNRRPLVDTTLKYDCPLILRLEDAFSSYPVHIRDWRSGSGGTEENPNESEIFLQADFFKWESAGDSLIVTVMIEDKRVFTFRVKWFGPHAVLFENNLSKMPTWISHIKNPDGSKVPDSLLVPNPSTWQELLKMWLPELSYLRKTKEHGVYRSLRNVSTSPPFERTKREFRYFEYEAKTASSEAAAAGVLSRFRDVMSRLRVVNLTEGSLVLLRTTHSSYAFRNLQPEYVQLYPVDILAAEVHFPDLEEVHQITKERIKVDRVWDCLEVVIDLGDDDFVALKLDWLGPEKKAVTGTLWEEYLNIEYKHHLMQYDVDRVGVHHGRKAKARAEEKYTRSRLRKPRVKSERELAYPTPSIEDWLP